MDDQGNKCDCDYCCIRSDKCSLGIAHKERDLFKKQLDSVVEELKLQWKKNTTINDECEAVVKNEKIEDVIVAIASAVGFTCDNCSVGAVEHCYKSGRKMCWQFKLRETTPNDGGEKCM